MNTDTLRQKFPTLMESTLKQDTLQPVVISPSTTFDDRNLTNDSKTLSQHDYQRLKAYISQLRSQLRTALQSEKSAKQSLHNLEKQFAAEKQKTQSEHREACEKLRFKITSLEQRLS